VLAFWKYLFRGIALLLLLIAGAIPVTFLHFYHQSVPNGYFGVRNGMSMTEVQHLLGCPPGDHVTVPLTRSPSAVMRPSSENEGECRIWFMDQATLYVFFNEDSKVTAKRCGLLAPRNRLEGLWQQYVFYPFDERD
jgi:hypothetical protein